MFESNVIYIGTKTRYIRLQQRRLFESNVIYIGTKTPEQVLTIKKGFESNVIYIGTKTVITPTIASISLRVM